MRQRWRCGEGDGELCEAWQIGIASAKVKSYGRWQRQLDGIDSKVKVGIVVSEVT